MKELKVEAVDEKFKKMQIKLATTCNLNEQQDAESNAGLWTKWMKTTWKTFEETIRRDRKRSIKA